MDDSPPFARFGLGHCLALALTVLVPLALAGWSRRQGRSHARVLGVVFAVGLLGSRYLVKAWEVVQGRAEWTHLLPMHFCDWALLASVAALLWQAPLAFELAWFWGLAGTLQAMLTPDLKVSFEDYRAWVFFAAHGGIIATGIYLAAGHGMRPRPWAVVRVWGWSQVYFVSALLVNWLFDVNYGYLCHKPEVPSLLDHLGPWPWYWLSLQGIAVVHFLLAALPFWLLRAASPTALPGPAEAGQPGTP